MTDDAINRLVAERVMGLDVREPTTLEGLAHYPDGLRIPAAPVPNYCTDPAAWGALLVWLKPKEAGVQHLIPDEVNGVWYAVVDGNVVRDALPGRALALAALRAYGVEVESGA